ncbi:MAG: hypothetical protein ACREQZ_11965 [Woeseiaceae bacterium]
MSKHADDFYAAVTVLVGDGNIKQRLAKAFEEHLARIDADALPVALRRTYADLCRAVTRIEPLNGEGAIRASVRKMSIHEARECACEILGLYGELVRAGDGGQQAPPPPDDDPLPLPVFLVKSGSARPT